MTEAGQRIPTGPLGTVGELRHPSQLRLGDMVPFDGVYYAIEDMCTARVGAKVLRFRDREPYTVDAPVLAYRQLGLAPMAGAVGYRSGD